MIAAKIPVFLLTGFLGSGKTTLLNNALKTPALSNTAVVVNELGEIGIDHLIISQAIDNVVLLDAGCLCCVNTGALHETLSDLLARRAAGSLPPFERVIIETSGAADPAPLLNVLLGHPLVTAGYALEATVCVVDAQHFMTARNNYPELDKQAALADRLVLTKTDLADPAPALAWLEQLNPDAEVLRAVPAVAAFAACARRHRPSAPLASLGPLRARSHSSGIRAFSFRLKDTVTWAGWSAWSRYVAGQFGAGLLRVKGLMKMAETGEIVQVDGVQGVFHAPQRFRDWPDADHGNRLVCIARDIEPAAIAFTLPALYTEAGSQVSYTRQDIERLHEQPLMEAGQ